MASDKPDKHLLETSLLVPLRFGSVSFRDRIEKELRDERQYTTSYVRMEFRRVALLRIAQFCIQLQRPTVRCADDLIADWFNHFGDRDAKFMGMLCRQLIPAAIDIRSPGAKPTVFRFLADLAIQLDVELCSDTVAMPDSAHRCKRTMPTLPTDATHPTEILRALEKFVEAYQDTAACRAGCRIDAFIERHREKVEEWIGDAETVGGDARDAMRRLAPQAASRLDRGLDSWSCRDCEILGDWVIALDCPIAFQLEHLDHVYDHLCPSLGLHHRKHAPDRLDLSSGK